MKKKKLIQENKEQHVGSSVFVLVGFATFLLMFISLGEGRSFRTNKLEANQITTESGAMMSKENHQFISTYMPYFEEFALHYNYEYSDYENYIQ